VAPPLRTRITRLLGIEHPILGGGLMWLSDARYVAARQRRLHVLHHTAILSQR
jgi:NAD(P)H-dependent flavin oxidoreductase YrpB (nitropropane dioxygenase family)